MRQLLTLLSVAGVAYGACEISMYMKSKRIKRLQKHKIEVWEGEGGAVPVKPTRTAAQVSPRRKPKLSPKGDGHPAR
jgi:hypothetical protein